MRPLCHSNRGSPTQVQHTGIFSRGKGSPIIPYPVDIKHLREAMACGIYIYLGIWDHGFLGRLDGISLSLPPSSSLSCDRGKEFCSKCEANRDSERKICTKTKLRFAYSSSRYSQIHVVGETKLMKDVQNRSK